MMFKKRTHCSKNDLHAKENQKDYPQRALTPEERDQLFKEMSLGWGIMSPGCFPDGIWHLY